jgi:hypothetical protein
VPCGAANRYDPALRFRAIQTPHFTIYFHQGEEKLAQRLAVIVEEVRTSLAARFPPAGRSRTHVILVDQTDLANGWATPLPYNTIEITAVAPPARDVIGNTDDWLRLVFSHEYTHVLHLERSGGWIGGLRRVFGRAPPLMPNLFLPAWQIEGLATFEESAITGRGRIPAGDFRKYIGAAASAGRFEPQDRVAGGLVDWPGGTGPYLYGGYFHEFLARRYGEPKIAELADATARRVPFFGLGQFERVFGRPLDELWEEFRRDAAGRPAARTSGDSAVRRLTYSGFVAAAPRWDVRRRRVVYAARDPHGFPALMALALDTSSSERLADRALGSTTGVGADALVFDQIETDGNARLEFDLYRMNPARPGEIRRLTAGARASDPDLAPDGRSIACVVEREGSRALAQLQIDGPLPLEPQVLLDERDTHIGAPRWSPDGRHIAAERQRLGGPAELIVFDTRDRRVSVLTATADARNVTPAWTPDGRTVLFASDRGGGPFNLFAVDVETRELSQLTRFGTGEGEARWPDVSPDGRSIVYVGYTVDGYDLFTMPFDRASWTTGPNEMAAMAGERPDAAPDPRAPQPDVSGAPAYTPWPTLLPRYWLPLVAYDEELEVGAATYGGDVLGRHLYYGAVTVSGGRSRPDWQASYLYDRWRPTLFVSASESVQPWGGADLRQQEGAAGVVVPFRRVRYQHAIVAAFAAERDSTRCRTAAAACPPDAAVDRRAMRLGWELRSARTFGYSISAEEKADAGVTLELVRSAFGASADSTAAAGQIRGFTRLGGRHGVLATRLAAGGSWGDRSVRRVFGIGGAAAEPALTAFGRDALGLLRGFAVDDIAGSRAAVVNLDYRWPLAQVQRGAGAWPVFLRSLHAAVFVDAGHAWDRTFRFSDVRTSMGAEIAADTVLGHYLPVTVAAGAAWRRDPLAPSIRNGAVFARIGKAF